MKRYEVVFYFSLCEDVEAENEEKARTQAEKHIPKEVYDLIGLNLNIDEVTVEEVEE